MRPAQDFFHFLLPCSLSDSKYGNRTALIGLIWAQPDAANAIRCLKGRRLDFVIGLGLGISEVCLGGNERTGSRARINCAESDHKSKEIASRRPACLFDRLLFNSAAAIVARRRRVRPFIPASPSGDRSRRRSLSDRRRVARGRPIPPIQKSRADDFDVSFAD